MAAVCFAVILALPATSAGAAPKAGALDRGFNGDGKLVTALPEQRDTQFDVNYRVPFEFASERIAMAAAGGGKIVAANSKAIVKYLADGRPDPRFGGNGAVPIGPIEGSRFQLADIAVDSRGRILVAGTARPASQVGMAAPAGVDALVGPLPSRATIRRYLPNGRLDPGFAAEGILITDLRVPPPTFEHTAYPDSAVAVVGLAVDSANRPVLTGSAVVEVGRCAPSQNRYQASQAIVARLNVDGTPDTSFANGGTRFVGGLSWLGWPVLTPSGLATTGTEVEACPRGEGPDKPSVLVSLGNDGSFNQAFAANSFWSRRFTRISDLAASRGGELVLLARTIELSRGKWVESAGRAIRLRRNGSLDASFGRRGQADISLPRRGAVAAIATDSKGRVLLAGSIARHPKGKGPQSKFLLMRVTKTGQPDRRFGRRGRVMTGFGKRGNVRATDVLVDRAGRVAVGGKFSGPSTGNGFALARYLGGRNAPAAGPRR